MTRRYIEPRWGHYHLGDVRTMQVEEWLHSLPLAPASKTKIKSAFSVLYSHAIRYEWLTFNPISKVRTSSKPLREKDVLSPEEFQALLGELSVRDRQWSCWREAPDCAARDDCPDLGGCERAHRRSDGTSVVCSQPLRRRQEHRLTGPVPLHPLVLE